VVKPVGTESVAAVLEREHTEIDAVLGALTAGEWSPDQDGLALRRAIRTLRRHIYVEEEFLFPLLQQAGFQSPVLVMLHEHAQIWASLDTLQSELDGDGVAETLRGIGRQLAVQLQHHNLKEEQVLYPRIDAVVSEAIVGRVQDVLDSDGLPDGWICIRARP
jgi:iron-sulfur cluster repair protein YtfE (RIC family)